MIRCLRAKSNKYFENFKNLQDQPANVDLWRIDAKGA